jgi:transcription antitermination factor NusG
MQVNEGSLGLSPATSNHGWYAIHTRYQHERVVAQILADKRFEIFLPLYTTVRHWRDRDKQLSLPLFSCYVFIKGGLDRRLELMTTPGIIGWVGIGTNPSLIPDQEIETVRHIVERSRKVEPHPYLSCGDRVRVNSGPLSGIEGILVRKKGLYRLVLSVEILASSAAVEVDVSCVERVKGGVSAPREFPSVMPVGWTGVQRVLAKATARDIRMEG